MCGGFRTRGTMLLCGATAWLLGVRAMPGGDMDDLVALAIERNPQVAAARAAVTRAEAAVQGAFGFYDPRAVSAAGWASDDRSLPGVTSAGSLSDDALSAQAGLEKALGPGLYLGVGVAERRLLEPDTGDDDLYQTLVGAQARIPLAKDRGFAQWRQEHAGLCATRDEAAGRLLRVCQDLQRDVELRYIQYVRAVAGLDIARAASERARRLLNDAESLVAIQVQPRHQVHPARMEMALRREDELSALTAMQTTQRRIEELAGAEAGRLLPTQGVDVVATAGRAVVPEDPATGPSPRRRGLCLEAAALVAVEEAALRAAVDRRRPDVSLQLRYTWQAEDPSNLIGADALLDDRREGGEVLVVWTHPLGSREERADIKAALARVEERREALRSVEWRIASDRDVAAAEFQAARERLTLTSEAVGHAREALAAEEERFRLGDGTSRQVLDAQKDLTAAIRRQNDTAADVLMALSTLRHAAGLTGLPKPAAAERRNPTP